MCKVGCQHWLWLRLNIPRQWIQWIKLNFDTNLLFQPISIRSPEYYIRCSISNFWNNHLLRWLHRGIKNIFGKKEMFYFLVLCFLFNQFKPIHMFQIYSICLCGLGFAYLLFLMIDISRYKCIALKNQRIKESYEVNISEYYKNKKLPYMPRSISHTHGRIK